MNLLRVNHFPVFGGPHNEALRLAGPLAARGWRTTMLLPDEPGNAAQRLIEAGIDLVQIPLQRLRASPQPRVQAAFAARFPREVSAIRRVLRERRIDLVLLSGLVNPHAAVAARLEGAPLVWQILDTRAPAALRRLIMPLVRVLADTVMFDGEALAALHLGRRPLRAPAVVYYPPVDTRQFVVSAERRRAARERLGISARAPVVGTIANLNPQKGIEYFVRAAALIHRVEPETHFVVVGAHYETHRRYTAQIEAEVRASGVPAAQFSFTGGRWDVEQYLPAFDVKLITSTPRSEGTTTTAQEAMACGVPVVATDVGAVAEVVADGETGCIVPPLDPAALAAATLALLRDPVRRARFAAAGRRRAVERFDVQICADTYLRAFDAAIARRGERVRQKAVVDHGPAQP